MSDIGSYSTELTVEQALANNEARFDEIYAEYYPCPLRMYRNILKKLDPLFEALKGTM